MELFGYTVRARGIPVADIDARNEKDALCVWSHFHSDETHAYIDYAGGTEAGWAKIDGVWVKDQCPEEQKKRQELRKMCDATPAGPWWVGKAGIQDANLATIVGDPGDWEGNADIEPTAVKFLEDGLVSLVWALDLLDAKDAHIARLVKEGTCQG